MSQIIKTILAIIGIIFGGLFILGGLFDGAGWPVLMGLAFLGPAVWWFMTKPGQRQWKAVIPLALLSFFVGAGMAPSTEQKQLKHPKHDEKNHHFSAHHNESNHHRHNNIGITHNQHGCLRDAGCVRQSHRPLCARSRTGTRDRTGTGVPTRTRTCAGAGNRPGAECLLPEL